jgi:hypothetical protein
MHKDPQPCLVLRTAHCPASLAGCSLAYQARLPRVEPAAYLLRTVLSRWAKVRSAPLPTWVISPKAFIAV